MTRRKVSREVKIEAVRLVTERGVAAAQACRDLDLAESVLRRWMRELTAAPVAAFPGNGLQRAELAGIAALKKEAAQLKAERDILKRRQPTSRGKRHDVRFRGKAPAHLTGQLDVRGAGRLPIWLSCLARKAGQRTRGSGCKARPVDRQELQGQRSHLRRPPGLA